MTVVTFVEDNEYYPLPESKITRVGPRAIQLSPLDGDPVWEKRWVPYSMLRNKLPADGWLGATIVPQVKGWFINTVTRKLAERSGELYSPREADGIMSAVQELVEVLAEHDQDMGCAEVQSMVRQVLEQCGLRSCAFCGVHYVEMSASARRSAEPQRHCRECRVAFQEARHAEQE